uniref:FBD-associated F-box protein At1g78730 n=1 Tax=Nicotiana tabacum TaxID=4097 RepID=A0A1S4D1P7_TOBAC|nr:PREDICTED: putative FBD-associated F-box protein At1g78730 [Nicotiana tabacum]
MVQIVNREDRISELPVHIVYDILCRIRRYGLKEEARTCVLSKTWSSIWRSRPDVIINQSIHNSFMKSTEKFIKFVDDSLRPYVEQNSRVETLRLLCLHDQELASHIDRWLNLVIKLNVRSLEIYAMFNLKYSVHEAICAAKTLTELSLRVCNFQIDNSTSTTNKLQRLISICMLIRDLKISRCWGIQNLLIFGLVNLEKLELRSRERLEKVEIQAPNLRKFVYVGVPLHNCLKAREPKLLPCTIDILDVFIRKIG